MDHLHKGHSHKNFNHSVNIYEYNFRNFPKILWRDAKRHSEGDGSRYDCEKTCADKMKCAGYNYSDTLKQCYHKSYEENWSGWTSDYEYYKP